MFLLFLTHYRIRAGCLNISKIPRTICASPNPNIPYPHASGVKIQPIMHTTTPRLVTIALVVIRITSLCQRIHSRTTLRITKAWLIIHHYEVLSDFTKFN